LPHPVFHNNYLHISVVHAVSLSGIGKRGSSKSSSWDYWQRSWWRNATSKT